MLATPLAHLGNALPFMLIIPYDVYDCKRHPRKGGFFMSENAYEFWFRLRNLTPEDRITAACVYHELRLWEGVSRSDRAELMGIPIERMNLAIESLSDCGLITAEWDEERGAYHITLEGWLSRHE